MKKELHDLAIKIFQCCTENQISLNIQLIPRSDLERVDYKSRIVDLNDWRINSSCFEYIEKLWGPHTVDCFANYYNKKVETFFLQFWNSNSSGVDFFCTECRKRELFGCSACNHDYEGHPLLVRKSNDWYTVIVPFWPSAYFWPVITRKFRDYVTGYEAFKGKWSLRHLMGTFWQSE